MDTNPVEAPLLFFHPLVAATTSIALGSPRLVPFIRTHDDVRSMCPSRATLYYTVILGVTFPCSTRIPLYLRSNPRGSNAAHDYPFIFPFSES
ncbi:hypothetical protein B0H14DRAFT_2694591, partial [Mycena olivaceomarginata]